MNGFVLKKRQTAAHLTYFPEFFHQSTCGQGMAYHVFCEFIAANTQYLGLLFQAAVGQGNVSVEAHIVFLYVFGYPMVCLIWPRSPPPFVSKGSMACVPKPNPAMTAILRASSANQPIPLFDLLSQNRVGCLKFRPREGIGLTPIDCDARKH